MLNPDLKKSFIEFHANNNMHVILLIKEEIVNNANRGRYVTRIAQDNFKQMNGTGDFDSFCQYVKIYFENQGLKVESYSSWITLMINFV